MAHLLRRPVYQMSSTSPKEPIKTDTARASQRGSLSYKKARKEEKILNQAGEMEYTVVAQCLARGLLKKDLKGLVLFTLCNLLKGRVAHQVYTGILVPV